MTSDKDQKVESIVLKGQLNRKLYWSMGFDIHLPCPILNSDTQLTEDCVCVLITQRSHQMMSADRAKQQKNTPQHPDVFAAPLLLYLHNILHLQLLFLPTLFSTFSNMPSHTVHNLELSLNY